MRSREEAARFIEKQLGYKYVCALVKTSAWHYGKQELRELMDFIYESYPKTEAEFILGKNTK